SSWSFVTGATGYAVERSEDGVHWLQVGTTSANNVTTYDDTGLFGSMRYFYRVSALNAAGRSTPSAVAALANRPNAPAHLTVTSLAADTLVLNWDDVTGETGYRISRSLDGIGWQTVMVPRNVTSYTETGLTPGRAYAYNVVAVLGPTESAAATAAGTTRQ